MSILYKELDQYLATAFVEVEKEADAFRRRICKSS